jgi:hypothetical protein
VNWTGARDIKAQLQRLWDRGDLLRDAVNGQQRFPLRLTLKSPGSSDITQRFDEVRVWAAALAAATPLQLEWQEVRHRVQGLQSLPASAWIASIDDALAWLGKRREWQCFSELLSLTCNAQPALLPWLEKRPLQALELANHWPQLLAVVDWLQVHPQPGIYLRQMDVPGVHTKFLEAHRGVLAELLDLALPAQAVDTSRSGVSQFARRYGFRDKPLRIRFRALDPAIQVVPGLQCPDMSLNAASFARLDLRIRRVFITENETNFLALPDVPDALVIFGAGYGWDALSKCTWLHRCAIHYWGDIDTHGFAILDQLRSHFGHVHSLLMDSTTLHAHTAFWGVEPSPLRMDLPRLTRQEQDVYDTLRDNRIRAGLRLEQETIGFAWVEKYLQDIRHGDDGAVQPGL